MFQNPFFKSSGQSSPRNTAQLNPSRPSVQDIMNKYKSPPLADRNSHVDEQILGSINESSNFLNEQSRHDKMFLNPISPQFDLDPPLKKDPIVRLTFGEEDRKFQMQDFSKKNQRLLNENDLYDDMSNLRDKVTNMLQRYSVALKAPDYQSKKNIKQQLEQDANEVAFEYSQIVDKFNNPDLSAISIADSTIPQHKEQQLTQMFNLVEEFLTKFKNISQQQQEKSQLLRSRINAGETQLQSQLKQSQASSVVEKEKQFTFQSNQSSKHSSQAVKNKAQAQFSQVSPPVSVGQSNFNSQLTAAATNQNNLYKQLTEKHDNVNQQRQSVPYQTYEPKSIPAPQPQTQQLDMTVYQQFPKMDDSFYDQKAISLQRINQKLTDLKSKLQQELQKDNMPYTQKILNEMISNLSDIINTQDYQLVKTIIFRIEQGIQTLSNNKEGSVNLYKYINKALMHSKMKTDLFTQRASMPVHMMSEQQNTLNKMTTLNSYQTPSKEPNGSRFSQVPINIERKERNSQHVNEKNIYLDQKYAFKPTDLPKPKPQINESRGSVGYERNSDSKTYSSDARFSHQLQFESRPSINFENRFSSNEPRNIYYQTQQNENQQIRELQRKSELQKPILESRNSEQGRPSEQTIKRLFFDAALTLKNKLPQNHQGRSIMVSDLYEEYVKIGGDMQKYIQQRFENC